MGSTDEFTWFKQAKPIWAEGREHEKNLTLGFRTIIEKRIEGPFVLKLS